MPLLDELHRLLATPGAMPVAVLLALAGLWFAWLRHVPAKLLVLMATAFIDMVGVLMVIPLLPFYAKDLGGQGIALGTWPAVGPVHVGIGVIVSTLVTAFTVAQLLSAPLWGRFSDRFGRRPALVVALTSSAIAYVIFAFANSLWLLLLSRIVQGAGGGTVGVVQAYVADSTPPEERAQSLGWLSAATNLGVSIGPALGSFASKVQSLHLGVATVAIGRAGPGLFAALLCTANIIFAWIFLRESKAMGGAHVARRPGASRSAVARVLTHSDEPASRLILIYAIAMGAFGGVQAILALFLADRWGVTRDNIGYYFTYIGFISFLTRAMLLGKVIAVVGEVRLSRIGLALLALGLATMPLAPTIGVLALATALLPLGTAFTFPCVTALLSRVIEPHERGLYMGVQQTYGGLARVLFPLVTGIVYDRFGHAFPFWISGTLVAATIFLGVGIRPAEVARKPVIEAR